MNTIIINPSQEQWPGLIKRPQIDSKNLDETVLEIINTVKQNGDEAVKNYSLKFHVYSLVWKQNIIQMYVDDQLYMTAKNTDITSGTWPFNNPSFLIFNLAVGGDWPGSPNTSTIFPQRLLVDYVRWFQ